MKLFEVTELQRIDKNKIRKKEHNTTYKAVMEEKQIKGEVPDKIVLTSDRPIDLKETDEVKFDKIAFQKSLKGSK